MTCRKERFHYLRIYHRNGTNGENVFSLTVCIDHSNIHLKVKPAYWWRLPAVCHLQGHVCPFSASSLDACGRTSFRGRMGIIKVGGEFILLSASVLSLPHSPQASWHFNKMFKRAIYRSGARHAKLFSLIISMKVWFFRRVHVFLCSGRSAVIVSLWEKRHLNQIPPLSRAFLEITKALIFLKRYTDLLTKGFKDFDQVALKLWSYQF